MPWITPIASLKELEPLTIRIGEITPPVRSASIDSLKTRAICQAALHELECAGPYQLEGFFSFGSVHGKRPKRWALTRNRLFDRWKNGTSAISDRPKKPSAKRGTSGAAVVRLAWLRSKSPMVEQLLRMALWRNLDPSPLTTELLDKSRCLPGVLSNAERGLWGLQMRTISGDFVRMARSRMKSPHTRWHFIDILWQVMRASYDWSDSTPYALAYLIWLDAKPILANDPAFGPIIEPLYALAASRFSCLKLSDESVFEQVVRRMEGAAMKPLVDATRLTIELPSAEILRVYDVLDRTWNPEENCA